MKPLETPRWRALAVFLAAITGALIHGLTAFPVQDAFHQGEFLAAAFTVLQGAPFEGLPFTIHGAADLFPALLLDRVLPQRDSLLALTLLMYPLMDGLAVVIVATTSLRMARIFGVDPLRMLPFILMAGYGVGWRDLFMVASLAIFTRLVQAQEESKGQVWRQVLFGLVMALGTYWSFNRGLAALVAFGLPTLWLATRSPRYAMSMLTAVLAFLAMGLWVPGLGIRAYADNLLMLLQTAAQWHYPRSSGRDAWWGVMSAITAVVVVWVIHRLRQTPRPVPQTALRLVMILSCVMYTKMALDRIDPEHLVMALWWPLLILAIDGPHLPLRPASPWRGSVTVIAALALAAAVLAAKNPSLILPLFILLASLIALLPGERLRRGMGQAVMTLCLAATFVLAGRAWTQWSQGAYTWVRDLPRWFAAEQAVMPGIRWSAQSLRAAGAHCVFDLVNAGLINAVAQLPACSRFTYPVYAGPQHEQQLISDLERTAPTAVVFKADFWSYAIDGRPMSARFPVLDATITQRYPREECQFGFCLRYKP